MKRWLKLFVTIALAISIPLQGLAGVAMPACNMSKDAMAANMPMNAVTNDVTMSQSDVKAASCDMMNENCCDLSGNKICSDQKCAICHLSILQLPDTGLLTAPEILTTAYLDLVDDNYQTFPPGLFHPPKHLFS
jgi:hypothetical protein